MKVISNLFFGAIYSLCFAIGWINPWWRGKLLSKVASFAHSTGALIHLRDSWRYLVIPLLDQQVGWPEMLLGLEEVEIKSRSGCAELAVAMYFFHKRFDEAREAAEYWVGVTKQLTSGRQDGRRALAFEDRLQEESRLVKAGVPSTEASWSGLRDYLCTMRQHYDANMVHIDYRTSQIASKMLDWSRARNDEPASQATRTLRINRFLSLPEIEFDEALADSMGMDATIFQRIKRGVAK